MKNFGRAFRLLMPWVLSMGCFAEITLLSLTDKYPTVGLSADQLSVSFAEFSQRAVRSTKSIQPGSGMYYFEGQRLIAATDMGFGITTAADDLDSRMGTDTQSVAINFAGNLWSNNAFQGNIPNAADTFGIVVDYRGTNPTVHVIGSDTVNGTGKFLGTFTLSAVTEPVYLAVFGVGPAGQYRLRVNAGDNQGAYPFRYDPVAVLKKEYYRYFENLDAMVVGWGVPDPGLNHFPVLTVGGPKTVVLGNPVTVSASATDAEDGNLTSQIAYTSSEGPTGSGASFTFTPAALGEGSVAVSVYDSTGSGAVSRGTIAVTAIASGSEDSDDDGLSYDEELALGTDPSLPDTDGDGLSDSKEAVYLANPLLADSDGDTMPDADEAAQGSRPNINDASLDPDGDGHSTLSEWQAGSAPFDANAEPDDGVVLFNPNDKAATATLSSDQRTVSFNASPRGTAYAAVRSDIAIAPGSGWYYFEGTRSGDMGTYGFGVASATEDLTHYGGQTNQSFGVFTNGDVYSNGALVTTMPEPDLTTVYGIAVDYSGAHPVVYTISSGEDLTYTTKLVLEPRVSSGVTLSGINTSIYIYAFGTPGTGGRINAGADPAAEPFTYPPAYTLHLAGVTAAEFIGEGWGPDHTYSGRVAPTQYDPVQLDAQVTPAGEKINLGPDKLSAGYTINLKMAIRANTGMYGQFRYFEANREIAAGNFGQGYISPHAFLNHLCCVSASLTGAPPCMSVNSSANVWRNLVQQATYNIANTHYGFAVDYRGSRPKVYTIIGGALIVTLNMTDFIAPIYPMLYGNTQGYVKTNTANFGQTAFTYDAKTILTNAGIDTTDLILGWGDANDHETPVITGQQRVEVAEDGSLPLTLAMLDASDPNGTPLTLTVANGTNYSRSGNTITPTANYDQNLLVPVTVSDGHYTSHTYNLIVAVTPVNDPPVLTSQANSLSTLEDTPLTLTPADLNFSDIDNSDPADFSVVIGDGSNYTHDGATLTPAANYHGSLSVPVTVFDGEDASNSLVLTVSVTPENDVPVISGPLSALSTPEETALLLTLAQLSVTDPDNSYPTGFSLTVGSGSHYTLNGNTLTPETDYNGTLTVPVTVHDGTDPSATYNLSVTVTAVNDVPVVSDQVALKTPQEVPIELLLEHFSVVDPDDTYPNGFSMTVSDGVDYSRSGPIITPDAGFSGILSVPITVHDGQDPSSQYLAQVEVCVAPALLTPLQNQTVCRGTAASYSAAVSGPGPMTYQWYKNGSPINGATGVNLSFSSAQPLDAASYSCVITNACTSLTTAAVNLIVNNPVVLGQAPVSQSICPGDPAVFRITASGTAPLSYQWRKNGQNIPLATASTYLIDNADAEDQASYDCVVSNVCGSLTSTAASLTINGSLAADIQASSTAAGLRPIILTGNIYCALPSVSYDWIDATRGILLASNANPYVINEPPSFTTVYHLVVTDELRETYTAERTILVPPSPVYLDLNGDGCNTLADLQLLSEEWLDTNPGLADPNEDGVMDVRDLLYIDVGGVCPP